MDPASGFGRTQSRYTALMKWGQLEEASEFVEPEIRGEFEALAAELSQVRIIDYSVRDVEFSQARTRATATVRLQAYWLSGPYPREVEVTQRWRRDALSGRWWVTPDIERIRQAIRTGS